VTNPYAPPPEGAEPDATRPAPNPLTYPPGYLPYAGYPPPARTSGLAIASLVLGLLWIYWIGSVLAVVFGHIALNEMRKNPLVTGRGLAVAGLILGYLGLGILALLLVGLVAAGMHGG
jgi:hypothetical protein